ncbi:MAG TPA: hypothetical protein VMI75_17285 [Polyangiaceae bacterium]|nr:hypothetical protein [Polyangiaceae bacterium]
MSGETATVLGKLRRPPAADGEERPPKIFVATPAYGGMVTVDYAMGLQHLTRSLDASGLQYQLALMSNESLITRARNNLVAKFRQSDCTHLLFIDADVGFGAHDVKTLLEARVDVVCGAYPLKRIGWQNVVDCVRRGVSPDKLAEQAACYATNATPKGTNGAAVEGMQRGGTMYLEMHDVATGFLLVTRDAIERYIAFYGALLEYTTDYEPVGEIHHRVFDAGEDPTSPRQRAAEYLRLAALEGREEDVARASEELRAAMAMPPGRYLSEDYWFSRRWQIMGGKVWLSLGARLTHSGMHTFRGDISSLFELAPASPASVSSRTDAGASPSAAQASA